MVQVLGEMESDVAVYRCCRLANPIAFKLMNLTIAEISTEFQLLDFFEPNSIDSFIGEIPQYKLLVAAANFDAVDNPIAEMKTCIDFWLDYKLRLPALTKFIQYCYTITTSSAAAERVFSILKRMFGDQQATALEDYITGAVMLEYNGNKV